MTAPATDAHNTRNDIELKDQLKATLTQAPDEDASALEARVLAQWRQVRPSQVVGISTGPVASLQAAWRNHPVLWTGALVALAMALWMLRPVQDPALDELMQPDLLTLIFAGEL
jgi:hypothetical protein